MTLLNLFTPEADESALGYYRRLASENHLGSWRDLARAVGVSVSQTALLGQPAYLGQVLGLDPSWTRMLAKQLPSKGFDKQRFVRNHDAVCPTCLGESPHLRTSWDHVYVTACLKHRLTLVDRCDYCQSHLSSARYFIGQCECGRDLTQIPTSPARVGQLWATGLISGSKDVLKFGPLVRGDDLRARTHLIRVLSAFSDPTKEAPPRNSAAPDSVAASIEFLAPLEGLLQDWPSNFQAHVRHRLDQADGNARTLNSALGSWYKLLKKYSIALSDQPFLYCVLDVAARNFPGLLGLDAAGLRGIRVDKPLPVKAVAQRLGVTRDLVITSINQNLLPAERRKFGERQLMYQVLEAEVCRIETFRAQWCALPGALKLLDVPESVLNALVAVQALETDPNWRKDIRKGGPVSVASIETLVNNIRSAVHTEVVDTDDTLISLRDLSSRRFSDKRALQTVFSAIVQGELHGVGKLPSIGVGGIQFRMNDVRDFFGTPILEAGLSIDQLCKLTGWKHETVSHWVEEGHLEAQSIMLRGQPCRVVLPANLLRFQREFVPLADLAKSLGSRSSVINRQLGGIPVLGAKVLPNGSRRGGLVRLHDLARAALDCPQTATKRDV